MDDLVLAICHTEGLDNLPIQPLSGGQVNRVYQVGDEAILRVGVRADAAERLAWEANLLRRLDGKLPAPRLIAAGEIEGHAYQVQARARGEKLHQVWKGLAPAAQDGIASELAAALRALHSLPLEDAPGSTHSQPGAPGFGRPQPGAPRYPTWAAYVAGTLERTLAEIKALGIRMAPGFLDLARRGVIERLPALEGSSCVLTHGDCWLGNILVENGHISAILDFEYALLAPPDYELQKLEDFGLYPNDYAEEEDERYTAADFAGLFPLLRKHYPALFAVERLRERVDACHLASALSDYLAWRKDNLAAIPAGRMAAKAFYMARISNVTFAHGARLF